jgi:hypothetical protein
MALYMEMIVNINVQFMVNVRKKVTCIGQESTKSSAENKST